MTRVVGGPRLDLGPAFEFSARQGYGSVRPAADEGGWAGDWTFMDFADLLIERARLRRITLPTRVAIRQWRQRGVPIARAEEIALCFEVHPVRIWGEAWHVAIGPMLELDVDLEEMDDD